MTKSFIPVIPCDDSSFKPAYPATEIPLPAGEATIGESDKWAREDHIHPIDTTQMIAEIPAKLSELINDTDFVSETFVINSIDVSLPKKLSELANDMNFVSEIFVINSIDAGMPKKLSELANDTGFVSETFVTNAIADALKEGTDDIESNIIKDNSGNIIAWSRKHSDGFIEQGGVIYINDFWVDGNERLIGVANYPVAFTTKPVVTNVTASGHVASVVASMHVDFTNGLTTKANIYIRSVVGGFQFGGSYIYWSAAGF